MDFLVLEIWKVYTGPDGEEMSIGRWGGGKVGELILVEEENCKRGRLNGERILFSFFPVTFKGV